MFCPECKTSNLDGADTCVECGYGKQDHPPRNTGGDGGVGSFLNFDIMITPMIMKIVYIVGTIGIALAMLFVMFTGGVSGFFGGLIGGALALVYFRVICELLVLYFKIHGDVRKIRNNTTK